MKIYIYVKLVIKQIKQVCYFFIFFFITILKYKLCFKALPFTKFPFLCLCVLPLPKISHTFHYYYYEISCFYTHSIGSALQVKLSNIVITGILVSSWFGRLFIFRRSTSSFLSVLDDINNSIAHLYLPLEITIVFHFEILAQR